MRQRDIGSRPSARTDRTISPPLAANIAKTRTLARLETGRLSTGRREAGTALNEVCRWLDREHLPQDIIYSDDGRRDRSVAGSAAFLRLTAANNLGKHKREAVRRARELCRSEMGSAAKSRRVGVSSRRGALAPASSSSPRALYQLLLLTSPRRRRFARRCHREVLADQKNRLPRPGSNRMALDIRYLETRRDDVLRSPSISIDGQRWQVPLYGPRPGAEVSAGIRWIGSGRQPPCWLLVGRLDR